MIASKADHERAKVVHKAIQPGADHLSVNGNVPNDSNTVSAAASGAAVGAVTGFALLPVAGGLIGSVAGGLAGLLIGLATDAANSHDEDHAHGKKSRARN